MDSTLTAAIVTAILAALALITAFFNYLRLQVEKKKLTDQIESLRDCDLEGLYVRCPNCGTKVALKNAAIYKEDSISDVSEKK